MSNYNNSGIYSEGAGGGGSGTTDGNSTVLIPFGSASDPGLQFKDDTVARGIFRSGGNLALVNVSATWLFSNDGSVEFTGSSRRLIGFSYDGFDRTSNFTINKSGRFETNLNATGAISWTLPTGANRGYWGEIWRLASHDVSLIAPAGVEMINGGVKLAAGSTITLTTDNTGYRFKAVSSTLWIVENL